MFAYLFWACQIFTMTQDPVRAAEIQQRALVESAKRHEREVRARQELEQRQFERKFNQLVEAVANFAKQYNEGKGQTWPLREAEKLRQAMRELQSLNKSLESGSRSSTDSSGSEAAVDSSKTATLAKPQ